MPGMKISDLEIKIKYLYFFGVSLISFFYNLYLGFLGKSSNGNLTGLCNERREAHTHTNPSADKDKY
jgi:hypothetical protein